MRDKTPIRSALLSGSVLQQSVNSGLHALTKAHRSYVDPDIRDGFADSLDIDAGLKAGHPQEHRWDYLLGLTDRRVVVGFEPHSAKQGEISIVISKRRAALVRSSGSPPAPLPDDSSFTKTVADASYVSGRRFAYMLAPAVRVTIGTPKVHRCAQTRRRP